MSTPSLATLKQALAIAEQIEKLKSELARITGGSSSVASGSKPAGKNGRRKMSPETIAKMRASQQARWAKKR